MVKKIAIDWDDHELRLVVAQCSGSSVKVSDAALIPISDGNIRVVLQQAISERGLENTDVLVAIGRGKAELRDLQLPEVPDDELPDMVRFQAIRSFASAGDSATVDYLITGRKEKQISLLAAAVGPSKLREIEQTTKAAQLVIKRIALRPLAAAALYSSHNKDAGESVLIDLLADDAEIVVARAGKVVFVRTVRLPHDKDARATALAGELKRSLIACGSTGSPESVVLWGLESVHTQDIAKINSALGCDVNAVNPFELVDLARGAKDKLPEHVGRLAPLVGLLQNDEVGGHNLIDFLNPRKREIKAPNPLRKILLIGAPIAAGLLIGFFAYQKISDLDRQIAKLEKANADMKKPVEEAGASVIRTARVDQFLDTNVNWLEEMRRLAKQMPPSEQVIVRSVAGSIDQRSGGGKLTVVGGMTSSGVLSQFQESLRDENHKVLGEGLNQDERAKDSYRWTFNESITIPPEYIHELRYAGLDPANQPSESGQAETESGQAETESKLNQTRN